MHGTEPADAALAAEARILSRYLIGRPAGDALARRYADVERRVGGPGDDADRLVRAVRRFPALLGPLDSAAALLRPASALRAKVARMAAVLEASPDHTAHFLPAGRGRVGTLLALAGATLSAAALLAAGVFALKVVESRLWPRT